MKIGYIGLGKMGHNMALHMKEKGHEVWGLDSDQRVRREAERADITTVSTIRELSEKLETPRIVWIMVPHGVIDEVLYHLRRYLEKGDLVVEGGNSFYKDTIRRAQEMTERGIRFLDAGVSGGPGGARNGACIMVGGEKADYEELIPLFKDLAVEDGYAYMGKHGAGHFVKMVHNGIEYGMMQAIAEGFEVLQKSPYDIDFPAVAELYNHGSVVTSRLVGWLRDGFEHFGKDLKGVSGTVGHTGEGEWTIKTAEELGISVPAIKAALDFRIASRERPSFGGKVLSAMRNMFGGHSIK